MNKKDLEHLKTWDAGETALEDRIIQLFAHILEQFIRIADQGEPQVITSEYQPSFNVDLPASALRANMRPAPACGGNCDLKWLADAIRAEFPDLAEDPDSVQYEWLQRIEPKKESENGS